jgi:branched-chain amino acid transport system ATP-binding protein
LAIEALSLTGVDAFYGESYVLQQVSFALQEGALLALLGRNGAGKTTCISAIMGLVPPRSGEIRLFGALVSGLRPEAIARRGVGYVPQGRRIFPSLSVKENLIVARRDVSGSERNWTLERIFGLFPVLKERQGQFAGLLSGGEQQMLAIGRALMTNPRVLLMDEPSEGLAPLIVAEVGRTIALLKREGQSIVLVEQNSDLALDLADHVVILNAGRCVFSGTAEQTRMNEDVITRNLGVFHTVGE